MIALHAAHGRAVEQIHGEIDEVAEVVPEDVVDPAAPVAGGADVHQPLDEEPPGDVRGSSPRPPRTRARSASRSRRKRIGWQRP